MDATLLRSMSEVRGTRDSGGAVNLARLGSRRGVNRDPCRMPPPLEFGLPSVDARGVASHTDRSLIMANKRSQRLFSTASI
jgi:hypothetical protein